MRKFRLDVDTLQIASFEPGSALHIMRGTVVGEANPRCPYTYCASCTIAYGCTWGGTCRAHSPVLPD
jgi:hypothetical protein